MRDMTLHGWTFDTFYPSVTTFEFDMLTVPDLDNHEDTSEQCFPLSVHQIVPSGGPLTIPETENAAFRSNAKDCFLHQSTRSLEADLFGVSDALCPVFVGDYDAYKAKVTTTMTTTAAPASTTINIIHHHYTTHVVRPVLVAPPPRARTGQKPQIIKSAELSNNEKSTLESQQDDLTVPKVKGLLADNGPKCSHCTTDATSLWRRIDDKLMCNACALYYKLHGVQRPLHLNTGIVKRRNRVGNNVVSKRQRRHKC